MPMLRTFPDSLNYNFENIKGIVHIHFGIDVEIKEKEIRRVEFYDILTQDHISLQSQYNLQNPNWKFIEFYYDVFPEKKEYIGLFIPREKFLIKFKEYYMKYLKKHTGIIEKYTKKLDPIATKHLKVIECNPRVTKVISKWIAGALMYLTTPAGEIREFRDDADGFFEKLDLHQEDDLQNPKTLLKEMRTIFNKFPKYNKEFKVWRGMNLNKTLKPGDIIKNPMPFPTSLLPYTARGFLGNVCCMIEVVIPKNFPVIFLHKYRFWEKEVIINSCKFEVISIQQIKRGDLSEYLGDPDIPWIQQFKRQERLLTEYIDIVKCNIIKD